MSRNSSDCNGEMELRDWEIDMITYQEKVEKSKIEKIKELNSNSEHKRLLAQKPGIEE